MSSHSIPLSVSSVITPSFDSTFYLSSLSNLSSFDSTFLSPLLLLCLVTYSTFLSPLLLLCSFYSTFLMPLLLLWLVFLFSVYWPSLPAFPLLLPFLLTCRHGPIFVLTTGQEITGQYNFNIWHPVRYHTI